MSYEQRFKVADLQPDVAIGIQLPMVSRNGRLFDQSYSTNVQALSNLHNLLLTNKGERIHQPEFGTDLLSHIFEQNEVDLQDKIGNSIESAIRFWLPYITIAEMKIVRVAVASGYADPEHGVTVSLQIKINKDESAIPVTLLATQNAIELL
jgi:phage baseplate assembly protein W